MKKFRFVGDPTEYSWPTVEVDRVYNGDLYVENWGSSVQEAALEYPDDWEEVQEQKQACNNQFDYTNINTGILPRIPNQDQPASSITKFEMAVFMAMQGLCTDPNLDPKLGSKFAVKTATELFKKLEKLKK